MDKLRIHGTYPSRVYRVLWLANELGLDYEQVPTRFWDGSTKTPEFLAINPNGRVPAIEDGAFRLWESLAINLYLAKKHGAASIRRPWRANAGLAMDDLGDDRARRTGAGPDRQPFVPARCAARC